MLRSKNLPSLVTDLVAEFLAAPSSGPRFHGRIRTTRPSLIATLTRGQFRLALRKAEDPSSLPEFNNLNIGCNVLRNVISLDTSSRELGAKDIAALRVVCEGPMNMSCTNVVSGVKKAPGFLLGMCGGGTVTPEEELNDARPTNFAEEGI